MAHGTAEMWETYEFRGHRVIVVQQWTDPYGQRMVRVRLAEAGEDDAIGLPEARFLQEAVAVPPSTPLGLK